RASRYENATLLRCRPIHVVGNIGNSHNPGRGTWNASVPRTRTHGKLRHGRTRPIEESRTHNGREKNPGEKKHHNFSYANASVHDTLPAIEERVENTTRAESRSASYKGPAKRLPHYLFLKRIGYKWMQSAIFGKKAKPQCWT